MNETDPSERSATNNSAQVKNYPPLAPVPSSSNQQTNKQEQAAVEKLTALVSKLERFASSGSVQNTFQIERNLMAQKIKELLEDVKIANENCSDYQKAINILASKVNSLRQENERLLRENKKLQIQQEMSSKYQLELLEEKTRTKKLLEKLTYLKSQVKEYFEDSLKTDQESTRIVLELRDQNTNFTNLLQKINQFRESSSIDKLFLSDEYKLIDQDYCKFQLSSMAYFKRNLLKLKQTSII